MPAEQWNNITIEDINKGIVIVDHVITYDNGQSSGTIPDFNEYVWVPIPNFEENFKRTAWTTPYGYDANGSWGSGGRTHLLAEVLTENYWWEEKTAPEYESMINSVEHYKGFYIGRYEASDNGSSIAQSKRNISPWIWVSQITAISACEKNTTENMHLIYGIEWDSTLNWLIGNAEILSSTTGEVKTMTIDDIQTNSSSWGNYSDSIGDAKPTGTSEYWKSNNIYDLAGNVIEWTKEKYSTGTARAIRGGWYYSYGHVFPAAFRRDSDESGTNYDKRFPHQLFHSTRL